MNLARLCGKLIGILRYFYRKVCEEAKNRKEIIIEFKVLTFNRMFLARLCGKLIGILRYFYRKVCEEAKNCKEIISYLRF